jgi:DNA primase
VLILPEGLDPADYVQKNGGDAFREEAGRARPLVEFMLRRTVGRIDLSSIEGQTRAVDEGLPIVESLKDEVRQRQYASLLADLAGVNDEAVLRKLARTGKTSAPENVAAARRAPAQDRVEREMLKILAQHADIAKELSDKVTEEHFQSDQNRKFFRLLMESNGDVRSLVGDSTDERLIQRLSQLAVEPLEGDPTPDYVTGVWLRLEEFLLQRRGSAIRQRLQKLNPTSDPTYDELFQELITLDGELRRLREGAELN